MTRAARAAAFMLQLLRFHPCESSLGGSLLASCAGAIRSGLTSPVAARAPGDCGTLEDLKVEAANLLSSTVVPAAEDLRNMAACWATWGR